MDSKPKRFLIVLKRVAQIVMVLAGCYALVLVGLIIWSFEFKLRKWPIYIHAAPHSFKTGDDVETVALLERLGRLGYTESPSAVAEPGQWSRSGSALTIFLRHSPLSRQGVLTGPVTISLDWRRISSIRVMQSLEEVAEITVEPELLAVVPPPGQPPELCRPVPLEKIPSLLIDAILLTEDTRFFTHCGIDIDSIGQALRTNLRAGRYVQGGSTIPQQLIRMTLLSPDKTLGRKVNEMALAVIADALYSKKTILQAYANRVYFGHWGAYPVRGVAEATRHFFGKDLGELEPGECALLAALIRAPNVINPYRHPERALSRRNMVLGLMFKTGRISRDTYEEALDSPVKMRKPGPAAVKAAALLDMAKEQLPRDLPGSDLSSLRQDVLTSLDPLLQARAESNLRFFGDAGPQVHLILANPAKGELKAFIAPGPGKWSGAGDNLEALLPVITIPALIPDKQDEPRFTLTSQVFVPNRETGAMTFRQAFTSEKSFLTQRLVAALPQEAILSVLKEFGVGARSTSDHGVRVQAYTPMELAQGYSLMARLGTALTIGPGIRVVGGAPSSDAGPKSVSVNPAILFLVNHLMKGVDAVTVKGRGEDRSAAYHSLLSVRDEAGVWSVAYRADALLLIRVPGGNGRASAIRKLNSSLLPSPETTPDVSPEAPSDVVFRKICVQSGLRSTSVCPKIIREPFLKGTQPVEWCPHRHDSGTTQSQAKQAK
ncbi:MAG: transglycosylase domain-containing protein [Desulfomonile tiedjei]|nr:transglycosylase domain-containing protein [Desulfomonile tiedjei]